MTGSIKWLDVTGTDTNLYNRSVRKAINKKVLVANKRF